MTLSIRSGFPHLNDTLNPQNKRQHAPTSRNSLYPTPWISPASGCAQCHTRIQIKTRAHPTYHGTPHTLDKSSSGMRTTPHTYPSSSSAAASVSPSSRAMGNSGGSGIAERSCTSIVNGDSRHHRKRSCAGQGGDLDIKSGGTAWEGGSRVCEMAEPGRAHQSTDVTHLPNRSQVLISMAEKATRMH